MSNPLISVITPVLNCRQYIVRCLESVLDQKYPPVEHLLIDGGSTDGTTDIIKTYQAKHPHRIHLITQKSKGVGGAWNEGIAASKGEVLGWLGADDFYEPDAARMIHDFFKQNPDAHFVYGGQNFVDEQGRVYASCKPEPFDRDIFLNKKMMIFTTSAFYRRQVIDQVGLLDALGNDFDLYLRISKKYPIHTVGHVLSNFRIHENSQTNGASIQRRKLWLKAWADTCLAHGGSRFSVYCWKYRIFSILGWALPVWNFIYFKILKIFRKRLI